jgi:hypothetical protein
MWIKWTGGPAANMRAVMSCFQGAINVGRRQFILFLLGAALLPACSEAVAADVVVYKEAT